MNLRDADELAAELESRDYYRAGCDEEGRRAFARDVPVVPPAVAGAAVRVEVYRDDGPRVVVTALGPGGTEAWAVKLDGGTPPGAVRTAIAEAEAWAGLTEGPVVTWERLQAAFEAGKDAVVSGLSLGELEADVAGLVLNMAGAVLQSPGVKLDEMLDQHYTGGAVDVRSWWGGWS